MLPIHIQEEILGFIAIQHEMLALLNKLTNDVCDTFYFPFAWNGSQMALLEYIYLPYCCGYILPKEKNSTKCLFFNSLFQMLHLPPITGLEQQIYKLKNRQNQTKFVTGLLEEYAEFTDILE